MASGVGSLIWFQVPSATAWDERVDPVRCAEHRPDNVADRDSAGGCAVLTAVVSVTVDGKGAVGVFVPAATHLASERSRAPLDAGVPSVRF